MLFHNAQWNVCRLLPSAKCFLSTRLQDDVKMCQGWCLKLHGSCNQLPYGGYAEVYSGANQEIEHKGDREGKCIFFGVLFLFVIMHLLDSFVIFFLEEE
ncbi:hypothetical protein BSKO_09658 [Bryopsis sp. KO-2023]|nr:hypothetical protein BSKO_09658 [Bryopsis sp. KO-2023]